MGNERLDHNELIERNGLLERNERLDEFVEFFKDEVFPILIDEDGKGIDGFKELVENRRKEVEANVSRRELIRKEREENGEVEK